MAAMLVGSSAWQAGPALTGLSAGVAQGGAPVVSQVFANPVLGSSSALSFFADVILTLGTAATATGAGGWIAFALLQWSAAAGPGETAFLSGTQLYPFDGGRYGQIGVPPSRPYSATEWLVCNGLLVPKSPFLQLVGFNNSSFALPTTAAWEIQFSGGDIG